MCVGLFYWHTQRQANYAKTRELFAPLYEYSGKLTPEEQKRFIEIYLQEVQDLPFRPRQKAPTMRFGITSHPTEVGSDHWIFEADGSFTWREGAKRGIVQIVDHYGNAYTVDLDTPTDMGMTEDTSELYAEIDRLFEKLTDGAFQRLSTLKKKELSVEIEKLFSSE